MTGPYQGQPAPPGPNLPPGQTTPVDSESKPGILIWAMLAILTLVGLSLLDLVLDMLDFSTRRDQFNLALVVARGLLAASTWTAYLGLACALLRSRIIAVFGALVIVVQLLGLGFVAAVQSYSVTLAYYLAPAVTAIISGVFALVAAITATFGTSKGRPALLGVIAGTVAVIFGSLPGVITYVVQRLGIDVYFPDQARISGPLLAIVALSVATFILIGYGGHRRARAPLAVAIVTVVLLLAAEIVFAVLLFLNFVTIGDWRVLLLVRPLLSAALMILPLVFIIVSIVTISKARQPQTLPPPPVPPRP